MVLWFGFSFVFMYEKDLKNCIIYNGEKKKLII